MQEKRRALGKGLEQLFNDESMNFSEFEESIVEEAKKNNEIIEVKLDELRPNPYQPRKVFDENALNELAESIKEHGVFQPVIIKKSIKGYEIIAGERRVRASKLAGKTTIPSIIRTFTDEQMMEIALLENLQRENLNAMEEAKAYELMLINLHLKQEELDKKLITNIENLKPIKNNLYIWKGDITTLKIDAIVNAANSAMLGCFYPMHKCIDNAIHSTAGTRLRLFCRDIINQCGGYLEIGDAKITPAFNLPCKYVLHTVGPIIKDKVSKKDEELLSLCYKSCLNLVAENNIESVAFCCISTGEFKFPNNLAVDIALSSTNDFLKENKERNIKIVFNVFLYKNKE